MTAPATRLRTALRALHWSNVALASELGYDEKQVRRWLSGAYRPPEDVLAWLETLVALHAAHGPP